MKNTFLIVMLLIGFVCKGQEFAEIIQVRMSINDKPKVLFQLTSPDSTKKYNEYKPVHIVNAIELMESKGWEVVTITNTTSGNIITCAYLRRKRK